MRIPHSKSFFTNILLAVFALTIVLLLVEISLRFLGMADPILYIRNSEYGYEPKPNQYSNRLFIPIYINDIGLRDNETFTSVVNAYPLIVVLGD